MRKKLILVQVVNFATGSLAMWNPGYRDLFLCGEVGQGLIAAT